MGTKSRRSSGMYWATKSAKNDKGATLENVPRAEQGEGMDHGVAPPCSTDEEGEEALGIPGERLGEGRASGVG